MLDNENITSASIPYPDVENGQPMDESIFDGNNKALLDKLNELINSVNNIKNTLSSALVDDSGADNINISSIEALNAENVQQALEELKNNVTNILLGEIPDGSLTADKFQFGAITSQDVKLEGDSATAYDLEEFNSSIDDVLLKLHKAYISLPSIQSNLAYTMAMNEIDGVIQFYKNVFYELFYDNQGDRIGIIDNRKIPYTGSLTTGATEIPIANLDVSTWSDVNWANQDYIGMIIDDGNNFEKIFVKNVSSSFSSSNYINTYPVSASLPSGKYTVTMGGGKGMDDVVNGYTLKGGKGGTISFNLDLAASSNIQIKKISNNTGGYGDSFWLLINNEVYAAVGGGGTGWMWGHEQVQGSYYNPQHGGDGGSDIGEDGDGYGSSVVLAGKGANLGVGGKGGVPDYRYDNNGPAPDGYDWNDPSYPGRGGGGGGGYPHTAGGCGYAGGGKGCTDYPDWGMRNGGGGGGSSYIITDPSVSVIENTRGTNDGAAYINITPQTNLSLKEPLENNYSNPTLYRSNLTFDNTLHNATLSDINTISKTESFVTINITNPKYKFYDLAMWLETIPGANISEISISLSSYPSFDESIKITPNIYNYANNDIKQVRIEANDFDGYRYAVVTFKITTEEDAIALTKVLGVIN